MLPRTWRVAGLVAWALLACASGARAAASYAARASGAPAAAAYPASALITAQPVTQAIAPDFLGLALEYGTVPAWAGPAGSAPDPVLVQLIRNLAPTGHPSVRIGGLSTDRTWWPVPGMTAPSGVTYALTPRWSQSLQSLARAVDARLILGINLEADSAVLTRWEARQLVTTVGTPWIGSLDLGNEPSLYTSVPWYRVASGRLLPWYSPVGQSVFSRGPSWNPLSFDRDYARLLAQLPALPIVGPDIQSPAWFAGYRRFLSLHSRVRMLVSHGYGLNNCVTARLSPMYPTIANLLSTHAYTGLLSGLQPYIALAHRNGASFRIDEMGSVTCNGRFGVANTQASALWAVNALFQAASEGVDGVNLHTYPGLANALFDLTDTASGWQAAIHPVYYGALLFARAAPAGAHLVRTIGHGPAAFHAWATSGPGSQRHIVLVNESRGRAATVTVAAAPPVFGGVAQLQRLSAANASSWGPISLGGQSFGATTTTGVLAAPVSDPLRPHRLAYRLTVPAASAVVLTATVGG